MKAYATYKGEDLWIEFSADASLDDYGVAGSPTFLSFDNITIESLAIDGVEVNLSSLSPEALDGYLELSDDLEFAVESCDDYDDRYYDDLDYLND